MSVINKILNKYENSFLNIFLILIVDIIISLLSSLAVILTDRYFLGREIPMNFALTWIFVGLVSIIIAFYIFKTYRVAIRHMSIKDVSPFIGAETFKILVVLIVFQFIESGAEYKNVFVITIVDALLSCILMIVVRTLIVNIYDAVRRNIKIETLKEKRMNVLIGGTGDKSVALVTRLRNSAHYNVVGFLKTGNVSSYPKVEGLPVYYYDGTDSIDFITKKLAVKGIIAPNEDYAAKHYNDILKDISKSGIKVLVSPTLDEASNGVVAHNKIREIKIEDLLRRKEILVDTVAISTYFKDKVVLVTGAAGSIGSELCRQLVSFGIKRLIMYDNAETPTHNVRLEFEDRFPDLDFVPVIGDIRNIERLDNIFNKYKPQVVFHAGAYKHVPLMEENPCEAVRANVLGTKNVVDTCIKYNVERMVMISTDKAVNPTNIMGCTKRLAEIYVQSIGKAIENGKIQSNIKFVTTRFGNVLGSNGSVIPRFKEQILAGGPVTVTHPDIMRFFMTIPEACRLVMDAATLTNGNEIFVFDMGSPVKIDTLARDMITLMGFVPDKDIKIEYTGLRPGEKLYEEILANKEETGSTTNQRIRIAKVREYDYSEMENHIQELDRLSASMQIEAMVSLMKKIVPEFKSRNSRFETLDN